MLLPPDGHLLPWPAAHTVKDPYPKRREKTHPGSHTAANPQTGMKLHWIYGPKLMQRTKQPVHQAGGKPRLLRHLNNSSLNSQTRGPGTGSCQKSSSATHHFQGELRIKNSLWILDIPQSSQDRDSPEGEVSTNQSTAGTAGKTPGGESWEGWEQFIIKIKQMRLHPNNLNTVNIKFSTQVSRNQRPSKLQIASLPTEESLVCWRQKSTNYQL